MRRLFIALLCLPASLVIAQDSRGIAPSEAPEGDAETPSHTPTDPEGANIRHRGATAIGNAEIRIDGRLDEAVWEQSEATGGFIERRPTNGATPPVETSFRILVSEDALYFGIRCGLEPGEVPRAVTLARDSFGVFSDDAISIKLDVRHDRRTTVGFATNAAGTQLDYMAIDNGRQFRREHDSVWEVATSIEEDAWYAEFRIPVAALGIDDHEGPRLFGLNLSRDHNLRRATYDWSPMPVQLGATSATHYGEVELDSLRGGRPLMLLPYLLAGYREDDESRFPDGSPLTLGIGGDARIRLGQDTWAELTLLTDFAQVDLDDPAINLDRFPLFFGERRPFFLTGLDVFEFGERSVAQPFFTRRIGLDEDRNEVLMWGGAKIYGRVPLGEQSLNVGLLHVITGEDQLLQDTVLRTRLNVGDASYVGALLTSRYRRSLDRPNLGAGVDFVTRVADGRFELRGFAAGSFNAPVPDGEEPREEADNGGAARLSARWRGENWRPSASVLWVGQSYNPALGFVRRRGVVTANTVLQYQHRTRQLGLEYMNVIVRGTQVLDEDFGEDANAGRRVGLELALNWVAGLFAYARVDYDEDVVKEEFELLDVAVAPGTYRGARALFGISRPNSRNPSFSLDYFGQTSFFGGLRQTVSGNVGLALGPHLRLNASGSGSFLKLPDSSNRQTFSGSFSFTVTPTTNLQFDGITQVNTASQVFTALARLRWRYLPGSDLFMVYRERRPYGDARSDPDLALERRAILKLSFRYDALL